MRKNERSIGPATQVLTVSQVSRELNVHRSHVYSLIRSGELAAVRTDHRGRWQVERAGIEEFIDEAYRRTMEDIERRWSQAVAG